MSVENLRSEPHLYRTADIQSDGPAEPLSLNPQTNNVTSQYYVFGAEELVRNSSLMLYRLRDAMKLPSKLYGLLWFTFMIKV